MAVARGSAVQEVYAVLYDDVMPSCMQYALVIVINIHVVSRKAYTCTRVRMRSAVLARVLRYSCTY